MIGWFSRNVDKTLQLGVCAAHGGLGAAVVKHDAGSPPRLQWTMHFEGEEGLRGLSSLAQQRKARGIGAVTTLSHDEYTLVMVDQPDVPPAEMRAAVRWRLNEVLDFHVDDAGVDIFDVPGSAGARSNRVYAVAARSAAIRRAVDEFTANGLSLAVIDIPEFALRNLAERLPEDANGVAVIALEAERGIMTITRQSDLYLSRRLDFGTARLFGAGPVVDAANEGVLDGLVIEIQRSLDYYERHFGQNPIQTIVLAPCAVPLAAARAYLQSQLGVTVREMDLNQLLTASEALDAATQAHCLLAIGSALRREEVTL